MEVRHVDVDILDGTILYALWSDFRSIGSDL